MIFNSTDALQGQFPKFYVSLRNCSTITILRVQRGVASFDFVQTPNHQRIIFIGKKPIRPTLQCEIISSNHTIKLSSTTFLSQSYVIYSFDDPLPTFLCSAPKLVLQKCFSNRSPTLTCGSSLSHSVSLLFNISYVFLTINV